MTPQTRLDAFERVEPSEDGDAPDASPHPAQVDLDRLSPAERRAWIAVRVDGLGMRTYARETGRSAGTVGNLLGRAEDKLGWEHDAGG